MLCIIECQSSLLGRCRIGKNYPYCVVGGWLALWMYLTDITARLLGSAAGLPTHAYPRFSGRAKLSPPGLPSKSMACTNRPGRRNSGRAIDRLTCLCRAIQRCCSRSICGGFSSCRILARPTLNENRRDVNHNGGGGVVGGAKALIYSHLMCHPSIHCLLSLLTMITRLADKSSLPAKMSHKNAEDGRCGCGTVKSNISH